MPSPVESDNPYAPPAAGSDGLEDMPGCWSVQGNYLVVRENAVLPPVDLDGRGAGGPLTPVVLRLPVPMGGKGIAAMVIPAAMILGYLAMGRVFRFGSWSLPVFIVASTLGSMAFSHFFQRGTRVQNALAFLWGQASVEALRAKTRRARWRGYLAWASTFLLFAFLSIAIAGRSRMAEGLFSSSMEVLDAAVGVACLALAGYFGVAVWAALDSGWRCTKARDGWLWIKGIGPAALAELARRSAAEPPRVVLRKVFRFRLQRLTLSEWRATNGFRPGAWWQTLLMLSRKTEGQEHLAFHWSERKWLEPAEGDPELVEAWLRDTAGTPLADWRMTHAERIDSPTRCVRSEEIVFLSPDGRHAAMSMVARVATGKGLLEDRRETAFRSWTEDGRILASGNQRVSGPLPEEMEFEVRTGPPWEMAQRHLERVAGETLVSIDAAGLRAKEEEEMQRRHEVLEDAGIYGPVEEMELAGDWD